MSKITSKEISVVVQGAVNDSYCTKKCIKSIRKFLPEAEIILSTWDGSNVSQFDYDEAVLSTDPGAVVHGINPYYYTNNTNRQLKSTQEGIKKATRTYILKIRTDFYLINKNLFFFFDKFNKYNKNFHFLNKRICVLTPYTRISSEIGTPTPFHISDFAFFGLKEDIESYFLLTQLMPDSDLANYPYKFPSKKPYTFCSWRYSPEQFFCVEFFKRHTEIMFDDWTDWNIENMHLSETVIMNNFIILDPPLFGVSSDKHNWVMQHYTHVANLFTSNMFLKKYVEIFNKPTNYHFIKNTIKLYKHLYGIKNIFKIFMNDLFSTLYYFIKAKLYKLINY